MTPDEINKLVDFIEQLYIENIAAESLLHKYVPNAYAAIRERAAKVPADAVAYIAFKPYRQAILEAFQGSGAFDLFQKLLARLPEDRAAGVSDGIQKQS